MAPKAKRSAATALTTAAAALAAVGSVLAWKKVVADRGAEADLWAEATDRVD